MPMVLRKYLKALRNTTNHFTFILIDFISNVGWVWWHPIGADQKTDQGWSQIWQLRPFSAILPPWNPPMQATVDYRDTANLSFIERHLLRWDLYQLFSRCLWACNSWWLTCQDTSTHEKYDGSQGSKALLFLTRYGFPLFFDCIDERISHPV